MWQLLLGPVLTVLSHSEVAHSWPQAECQWSPLPPGLTAKGEAWKLLLYSNYLALSSLFQAPAGESGTGNSRREAPYSPSNQQVRLLPGQAIRTGKGREACFQGRVAPVQKGRGSCV